MFLAEGMMLIWPEHYLWASKSSSFFPHPLSFAGTLLHSVMSSLEKLKKEGIKLEN